jgi:drug/metabolite transporter (DMT)-like permease
MTNIDFSKKTTQFIVLGILGFVWGSSFILIKKSLLSFSPLQVGSLRILIASLVLLPFAIKNLKWLNKRNWYYFTLTGLLGNGIPAILFSVAQTKVSSSITGFTNSLTPLFTLIVGILVFNQGTGLRKIIGILVGLLGAALLILSGNNTQKEFDLSYGLLAVLGSLCYGFSVNIIKNKLQHIDPIAVTSIAFLFLILPTGLIFFISDWTLPISKPLFTQSALSIITLSVIGTSAAVLVFNMLIKHTTAVYASSTTYIVPVFALMWGIFDHESFNLWQLSGIGLILSGVYLSSK